jgi:hypothetical protein
MPDVILLALAQRPPSRLGDPQSGDLDPVIAREHALGRHARESGADQLDQHLDREAVRPPRSRRCGTRAVRARGGGRAWGRGDGGGVRAWSSGGGGPGSGGYHAARPKAAAATACALFPLPLCGQWLGRPKTHGRGSLGVS